MANWLDVKDHPETSWTCQMTVPRVLGLTLYKNELVLTQHPICEETYEMLEAIPESGSIELTGFATVGYNADRKVVFINNYEAPYEPIDKKIHLKVVVDNSSVELFTGDGVRSISLSVFPPLGASRELEPRPLIDTVL
jgi:sucrose-6-phosphate hydrolase SacC (GH32 family)